MQQAAANATVAYLQANASAAPVEAHPFVSYYAAHPAVFFKDELFLYLAVLLPLWYVGRLLLGYHEVRLMTREMFERVQEVNRGEDNGGDFARLIARFRALDPKRKGLTYAQVERVVAPLGLDTQALLKLAAASDVNNDQIIEFHEFVPLACTIASSPTKVGLERGAPSGAVVRAAKRQDKARGGDDTKGDDRGDAEAAEAGQHLGFDARRDSIIAHPRLAGLGGGPVLDAHELSAWLAGEHRRLLGLMLEQQTLPAEEKEWEWDALRPGVPRQYARRPTIVMTPFKGLGSEEVSPEALHLCVQLLRTLTDLAQTGDPLGSHVAAAGGGASADAAAADERSAAEIALDRESAAALVKDAMADGELGEKLALVLRSQLLGGGRLKRLQLELRCAALETARTLLEGPPGPSHRLHALRRGIGKGTLMRTLQAAVDDSECVAHSAEQQYAEQLSLLSCAVSEPLPGDPHTARVKPVRAQLRRVMCMALPGGSDVGARFQRLYFTLPHGCEWLLASPAGAAWLLRIVVGGPLAKRDGTLGVEANDALQRLHAISQLLARIDSWSPRVTSVLNAVLGATSLLLGGVLMLTSRWPWRERFARPAGKGIGVDTSMLVQALVVALCAAGAVAAIDDIASYVITFFALFTVWALLLLAFTSVEYDMADAEGPAQKDWLAEECTPFHPQWPLVLSYLVRISTRSQSVIPRPQQLRHPAELRVADGAGLTHNSTFSVAALRSSLLAPPTLDREGTDDTRWQRHAYPGASEPEPEDEDEACEMAIARAEEVADETAKLEAAIARLIASLPSEAEAEAASSGPVAALESLAEAMAEQHRLLLELYPTAELQPTAELRPPAELQRPAEGFSSSFELKLPATPRGAASLARLGSLDGLPNGGGMRSHREHHATPNQASPPLKEGPGRQRGSESRLSERSSQRSNAAAAAASASGPSPASSGRGWQPVRLSRSSSTHSGLGSERRRSLRLPHMQSLLGTRKAELN